MEVFIITAITITIIAVTAVNIITMMRKRTVRTGSIPRTYVRSA